MAAAEKPTYASEPQPDLRSILGARYVGKTKSRFAETLVLCKPKDRQRCLAQELRNKSKERNQIMDR